MRKTRILLYEFADFISIAHRHEHVSQNQIGVSIRYATNGRLAIADRKATAMSAGTECSSGIHATAVSASCSLKGRPVSTEQRPAATNPVSGRGLGRQPGGSNTTDLAENEFGLLAAIVSLLREFGAARSVAIGGLFGW